MTLKNNGDVMKKIKTDFKLSEKVFWLIVTVLPLIIFSTVLSLRTMPVAEGWYSVYAKLINGGKMPYKDFELLFMPLYTYIIALITRVFGYNIIVLRIFGVLLFAGIGALAYGIFTKLFKPWIASISAIVTALFMQSEVVQIFYDYIRVFDFLAYCATFCLISYADRILKGKEEKPFSAMAFLCGLFGSLSFLVRQNSGAFVLAFSFVLVIAAAIYLKKIRLGIKHTLEFFIGAVLPIVAVVIFMQSNGVLGIFLNSTVGGAIASKGGILTVLFAWIPRVWDGVKADIFFVENGLLLILCGYLASKYYNCKPSKLQSSNLIKFIFPVCLTVGFWICWEWERLSTFLMDKKIVNATHVFFAMALVVFAVSLITALYRRSKNKNIHFVIMLLSLSGMIVALAYGCGTSYSISEGQIALAVGLFIGLVFHYSNHKLWHINKIIAFAIAFLLCFNIVSAKYENPYSWWGLTELDLRTASKTVSSERLKGIKVSQQTKNDYERIIKCIEKNTEKDDGIFVTPQAPIFYLLTERYPTTYTVVQWFDVASDKNVRIDADNLKKDKPRLIVNFRLSEYVMGSHEGLFRESGISGYRYLLNTMDSMIADGTYKVIDRFEMQGYQVEIYLLDN